MARKRLRVDPTEDFQEILPLCWWPEQVEYERIRQPVLFGTSVTERAEQTGVSRRTLHRRIARFGEEGMEGLFQTETAKKRQKLPPNIRRFIVDLRALSTRPSTSTRWPTWSAPASDESRMSAP
jgi:hypothetical protein